MKSILFSNEILFKDPLKKVFMDLNLPNKPFSEAVCIISFNVSSEILANILSNYLIQIDLSLFF